MADQNEDKFVHEREQQKIEDIRRERRLAALQKEEREGIAAALDTTEDVAEEALSLGFDAETSRILHLIPLIHVAWADGSVSRAERTAVLEAAAKRGLDPKDEAYAFLEELLDRKPTDLFFERANHVIVKLLEHHGEEADDILAQLDIVAKASGGFFGLKNSISDEEETLIAELKTIFKHD